MFAIGKFDDPDLQYLQGLHVQKILESICEERLNLKVGSIDITCSDCDRYHEKYTHLTGIHLRQRRPTPRIHPLNWNGGPLRCVPGSPLNQSPHEDKTWLNEIKLPRDKKGLNTLISVGHWPCGKAQEAKLTVQETMSLLAKADQVFRAYDPDMQVVTLLHVDFGLGDEHMKTYRFNARLFAELHSKELVPILV